MNLQIEGTQTGEKTYEVTARPDHGKEVTFYVVGTGKAYVKTAPTSTGYISAHRNFETAVRSANFRARRYVRAYSKPRGIQAVAA